MKIHSFYPPFLLYFRKRGCVIFYSAFGITPGTRVLDVSGTWFNWSLCPLQPNLAILNLYLSQGDVDKVDKAYKWVIADGRWLPFKDKAFDIVYSNAVIEYLGDWASQ